LDNLRGLSAIYVVLFHTALVPTYRLPLPALLKNFVLFGGSGVLLFFAISGFSLSLTMPRHLTTATPALSYALSRFFRIAPLFYFLLLVWGGSEQC
jgi:peptidoglycan/LPS O-acetylase OafA/YrhL